MKLVKNILGALWAVWGIVSFIATMLIIIIPVCITFAIKDPRGTEVYRRVTKVWMNAWLFLVGAPLKVVGEQNFKKGKNYVVACNHNSLMDVPVTTPYVPGANKTIGKKSFTKAPIFNLVYIRGTVLVDRNSDKSRRQSFEAMKSVLAAGMHMVIYPEGTRNRTTDPLKSFHDGAFKLAVDCNKDIIPTLIFNTRTVLPPHKAFFMRPKALEMHFLPAISSANTTPKELKQRVFEVMWNYYDAHAKQLA